MKFLSDLCAARCAGIQEPWFDWLIEFTRSSRRHLHEHRVEVLYVEPGSPWQNGIIESFNGRLRDECLDVESFYSLEEAKVVIEDYRRYYKDRRPHSELGYTTPSKYAAACAANDGVHPSAMPSSTTREQLVEKQEQMVEKQDPMAEKQEQIAQTQEQTVTKQERSSAKRGDAVTRGPAKDNRVDEEGGEAPLPLQTSPTTPRKVVSATPDQSRGKIESLTRDGSGQAGWSGLQFAFNAIGPVARNPTSPPAA
jgi:hypothetical protein